MAILTGPEIKRQVELGNILIDPFDPARLGPNSYDVSLGNVLLTSPALDGYGVLDLTREIRGWAILPILEEGVVLQPGVGYLGHTVERMKCKKFVPWLDGRSSVGRHFLMVHMTAGRGDVGWEGTWTLEMMAMYKPVRVYPGLPICQVTFFSVEGEISLYKGRYSGQTGPQPPKPFKR